MTNASQKILDDALAEYTREQEQEAICTNWILVAAFTDVEGKQWTSMCSDENSKAWHRLGLLQYALQDEQAEQTIFSLRPEE